MEIGRWADLALQALFDPACVACGGPLGPGRSGPVCATCWTAIKVVSLPLCDRCGEPLLSWRHTTDARTCERCKARPPHFDLARACGLYEGALREIVHALKYRGHRSLAAPLGALMKASDQGLLAQADAVVPVPLHPWRFVRRGFNQATELARRVGRPVWQPLRRRSLGVPQAALSGERRWENIQNAYTFSRIGGVHVSRRPRHVVLIDDVMTTGATLDACSRALREAGVEWIGALTLARTTANASAAAAPPPRRPVGLHPSTLRRR